MKVEKRSAKGTEGGGKDAKQFHYFICKAQCDDKKILQTNINTAARFACGITDSPSIDSVVKQVVKVSTKKERTEIAIFLTDSIMRHAARSGVDGLLERYQKRLKPHLRNLFKRALRRQGKDSEKTKLATRLKDKVLAKWKAEKWFQTDQLFDLVQLSLKHAASDDEGPEPDDEAPELVAVKKEPIKSIPKGTAYAGFIPATPQIGKAKAPPSNVPFKEATTSLSTKATSPAAPFSPTPFPSAVQAKPKGIPRTPVHITGVATPGSPRAPGSPLFPLGRRAPGSPIFPLGMPKTPATITTIPRTPGGMPPTPVGPSAGLPRTPVGPEKGLPRTPGGGTAALPRTPGAPAPGLPRTPAGPLVGLPRTPRGGDAVPRSPGSDAEPPAKRQRLNPLLPNSPPEILHSVPRTPLPQSPLMSMVPRTPIPGEAVPQTPIIGAVPGTPRMGAVPGTPTAPMMGAVPGTPRMGAVPGTPTAPMMGAVPGTPKMPGTPKLAAVPGTPTAPFPPAAPRTPNVGAIPRTPAGAVPQTPKAGAPAGAVPLTPRPNATAAGTVPITPKPGAPLGAVPSSPPSGVLPTSPLDLPSSPVPLGSVPIAPKASLISRAGSVPETPSKAAPAGTVPNTPKAGLRGKSSALLAGSIPSTPKATSGVPFTPNAPPIVATGKAPGYGQRLRHLSDS